MSIMKEKNIKLHLNITKIFKYLVFIVAFLLIGVVGLQENVEAKDQTLVMYNDDFVKATGTNNNNTYNGNVYYKRDDSGSWDGSKKPFNALVIIVNSTLWVDLGDAYLKVCAYGDSNYYSSTCLTRKTLSYGPGNKDISDHLYIYLHFNKNVEVKDKCKNCQTDTFNFYDYISPFAKKGKKYRIWIDLPTTVSGILGAEAIPTRFYLDTGLFVGPTATINDDSNASTYAKSHTVTINTTITTNHPEAEVDTNYKKYCWSTYSDLQFKNINYLSNGTNSCYLQDATEYTYTKSSVTGKYYLYYVRKDKEDDHYSVARSSAHYFDNVKPNITVTAPDDASTWAKSHTVSGITFSDSHSGVNDSTKYYCWSESSTTPDSTDSCWTRFTGNSVTNSLLTGEYYLHVQVSDNAGNVGYGHTASKIKFDNTAPTIKDSGVDSLENWLKSHTVSLIRFEDGHSGVDDSTKKYCWSLEKKKGTCTLKSFTGDSITESSLTGEYYLHLQVSDNVGNTAYFMGAVALKFDNTAPEITIDSITNDGNWAKNHTVTVTVKDPHSGNTTLHYCWSANSTSCSGTSSSIDISGNSDTKTISGDTSMSGTYYLLVWAEDQLENTSSQVSSSAIYFDNGNPSITLPTIQEWKKTHTVNFTIGDTYSGVSIVKYCLSQSGTKTYSSSDTCWETYSITSGSKIVSASLTFDGVKENYNGIYYLHVYAGDSVVDSTKNTNQSKTQLKFDNTKPVISSLKADSTGWKQKHSVTFSVKDDHSGISLIKYCLSENEAITYSSTSTCWKTHDISRETNKNEITGTISLTDKVNGIYYLHLYVEDSVVEVVKNSVQSKVELKYDNEKPNISILQVDSTEWKQTHRIDFLVRDEYSGVSSIKYCLSDSSVTPNITNACWKTYDISKETDKNEINGIISLKDKNGEFYLHMYVIDSNEDTKNETTKISSKIKFDNEIPDISLLRYDPTEWKQTETVYFVVVDNYSGVGSIKYCLSDSSVTPTKTNACWKTYNINNQINKNRINGSISLTDKISGKYYLHMYVTDSNEGTKNEANSVTEQAILLDNTAPSLTLNIDSAAYAKTHKITITAIDAHSGLETTKYYCNGCSDTDLLNRKNIYSTTGTAIIHSGDTGSYNIKVLVYDKVGNYTIKTSAIYYLDNTAPVIDSINSGEMITTNNNKLIIKVHDAHVGVIKTLQVNYDGETYSLTKGTDGNYTHIISKELRNEKLQVTITLIDSLGNSDSKEYTLNIDTVTIKAFDKNGEALERIELPKLSLSKPKIESIPLQEEVEENIEISEVVVLSEEIEVIEVNEIEEVEEIETKVVELPSSEVSCNSVNFSYVNEELKKLFVIEKKNNKSFINKK